MPQPLLSAPIINFYSGNPLDRAAGRRTDKAFLAELLRHPDTLILPIWKGLHFIGMAKDGAARQIAMPMLKDSPALAAALTHRPWAMLGLKEDRGVIALDLGDDDDALPGVDLATGAFLDLRDAAALLPAAEASVLAHARALMNWRQRHRFCSRCGAACTAEEAGHVMHCNGCGTQHFPRTDPAVIMSVTHGDRILLARGVRFRDSTRFSVLAGFVEPGESLEEAVARESWEEAGIKVTNIRYHSSQPWPFPGNIMLGFTAEAVGESLVIDEREIVEARWFTRAEIRTPESHGFTLPNRQSIARTLIDEWLAYPK